MAFDMPPLSPTAFRSIPALLLSDSAGWFVVRGPLDRGGRLLSWVQSPIPPLELTTKTREKTEGISFIICGDLASEPWFTSCDYQCKWSKTKTSMSLLLSNKLTKRPSVCICQLIHMCNLTIPIPPTNMDVTGCFEKTAIGVYNRLRIIQILLIQRHFNGHNNGTSRPLVSLFSSLSLITKEAAQNSLLCVKRLCIEIEWEYGEYICFGRKIVFNYYKIKCTHRILNICSVGKSASCHEQLQCMQSDFPHNRSNKVKSIAYFDDMLRVWNVLKLQNQLVGCSLMKN